MDKSPLIDAQAQLSDAEPGEILRWALDTYGDQTAISFSGAEDVALIHLAASTGLPFSVFTLDTGRLHPETLQFMEDIQARYGISIEIMTPDSDAVDELVAAKGLFSFYEDGHKECCQIRKVEPLRRALAGRPAWVTGQRRDQSPDTRGEIEVVEEALVGRDQKVEVVEDVEQRASEVARCLDLERVLTAFQGDFRAPPQVSELDLQGTLQ